MPNGVQRMSIFLCCLFGATTPTAAKASFRVTLPNDQAEPGWRLLLTFRKVMRNGDRQPVRMGLSAKGGGKHCYGARTTSRI
uniref:Putative secreted protein n=1 Tax=Anopheles marajoara TaxID=58244 RepID=A0A2M4CBM2_9DIPT